MYAARGDILRPTGRKKFDDKRFTQELLPNYTNEYPIETADWDVIYDARGNLIEPHTQRRIPLGTLQVRQYLGDRPAFGPVTRIEADTVYPTSGPKSPLPQYPLRGEGRIRRVVRSRAARGAL
jgi:hypothetical protein